VRTSPAVCGRSSTVQVRGVVGHGARSLMGGWPSDVMAVYDLSALSYAEQLRWRAQHCLQHAATTTAPDLTVPDWESFDPLLHREHIHTRLPTHSRPGPSGRTRKVARP
ncbi:hypothetical protein PV518_33560, partial [Streptomyces sp. ND04-05B]|nr:hypothetical protein [Streptomyces sp. ND04-05B]